MSATAGACSTCSARCCYEYSVTVTGYDVYTMATGLGMAPHEFLVHVPARPGTAAAFRLDQSGQRFDIALDKAPGEGPHRPCIFLMELPGGGGRCGIHAHRPQVCRTYPARLNGDVVALRDEVLCPTGAWKLVHMEIAPWKRAMREFVVHRDVYGAVVGCWDRRVERAEPGRRFSILEYFDFLVGVYRSIDTLLMEELDDWPEVAAEWADHRQTHGDFMDAVEGIQSPAPARVARAADAILERIRLYDPPAPDRAIVAGPLRAVAR